MKKETIGINQIILSEFLIAIVYILVRFVKDFGNYNLAFFRILFAALFIGVLFVFSRKYKLAKIKKEKLKILVFGMLHGFIIIASFISLNLLSIASAVLLQSTAVVWMALFSVILLKEKINLRIVFALLISLIGILLLFTPQTFFIKESLFGTLAALFVGIFGGLVYVISKTFRTYDKVSLTFWQNLIALPFIIPLLFVQPLHFNLLNLTVVVLMGLFAAVSFVLLYKGLGVIKGTKASVLTLLYAVFSIILAFVLFHETITLKETIGGLLILVAAYLSVSQ